MHLYEIEEPRADARWHDLTGQALWDGLEAWLEGAGDC